MFPMMIVHRLVRPSARLMTINCCASKALTARMTVDRPRQVHSDTHATDGHATPASSERSAKAINTAFCAGDS
jgi:hypothetical protein